MKINKWLSGFLFLLAAFNKLYCHDFESAMWALGCAIWVNSLFLWRES